MEKYQVIFISYSDEEVPYTEQYFNSDEEADIWVEGYETYKYEEVWNSTEQDYNEEKVYYYYNPQDKQEYSSYRIEEIPSELNEDVLKMQKLAGLITEEEYKTKFQEVDLMNLSNKISKKCDLIKQHLKDQGYDI
jgi:hypothetical protein